MHVCLFIYTYIHTWRTCASAGLRESQGKALQDQSVDSAFRERETLTYGWPLPCLLDFCSAGPWLGLQPRRHPSPKISSAPHDVGAGL